MIKMNYLKIQNNGLLNIKLISLMGGTTKKDKFKIGKFGTGLKYVLAYLIRNNIDFKIFVGEREVKITTVKEVIQETEFEIIYIDGQRSSITSQMGGDWDGWMIVREIWCNALDEGGAKKELTDTLVGEPLTTTFYLQNTGDILKTVETWGNYFLETEPIYSTAKFAIYPPSEHLRIYKNGVLIQEQTDEKAVFSYDIKDAPINEMREYKGYLSFDIQEIIKKLDEKTAEIFLNNVNEKHYESDLDFTWGGKFGDVWKKVIGQGKIISKKNLDVFEAKGIKIDRDGLVVVPEGFFNQMAAEHPTVSSVRRADKVNSFHESFDSELELQIKAALIILETVGYEMNPELKFIYGHFGDPSTFACINKDEKLIMFSLELKRKSRFDIITTIVEENEHFITGFNDESRSFQQHFIDLYVKTLLVKNEVLL